MSLSYIDMTPPHALDSVYTRLIVRGILSVKDLATDFEGRDVVVGLSDCIRCVLNNCHVSYPQMCAVQWLAKGPLNVLLLMTFTEINASPHRVIFLVLNLVDSLKERLVLGKRTRSSSRVRLFSLL